MTRSVAIWEAMRRKWRYPWQYHEMYSLRCYGAPSGTEYGADGLPLYEYCDTLHLEVDITDTGEMENK